MNTIPTQLENPKGFHQRYHIIKVKSSFPRNEEGVREELKELVPTDENAAKNIKDKGMVLNRQRGALVRA